MIALASAALLLPLASFALLAALPQLRRGGLVAGVVSSAFALVSLTCATLLLLDVAAQPGMETGVAPVLWVRDWLPHAGTSLARLGVRVDGVSAGMTFIVSLVASAVQVYSLGYMAHEGKPSIGRYFAWQSLFLFAMLSLVLAPDLLQAFAGWELVGLCSYLLIGFYYQKPSAAKAAVKAFWVTKFADMGLLAGLVLMRWKLGTWEWDGIEPGPYVAAVALLIFVGAMGKSAQFPLHVWLPDAMEGPTPVSALLHAATMVAAGVYLIVRAFPIFEAAGPALQVLAYVGSLTAFIAACTAVVQDDIKKVLAYSTCSQLGYMVAGLGAGSAMAGYFHLTTHAFFKALLFLAAGAAIHAVHSNSIKDMGGLLRRLPGGAVLFITGALALMGIPGFSGFFSKDLILEVLEEEHLWVPFALCLASAGLTAFYMGRVIFVAYLGKPAHDTGKLHTPWVMAAPMAVLAVLAIFAGLLGPTVAGLVGGEYHFALSPAGIAALVFAFGGLGVAWFLYGGAPRTTFDFLAPVGAFIRSGPMDKLYETGWRSGLLVVAAAAGWWDRYIVDGLMNLTGWAVMEGGQRARRLQTGKAPDYVLVVVVALIVLAAWGLFSTGATAGVVGGAP
jgi:NADH-quinone oxidoreductase subunit L